MPANYRSNSLIVPEDGRIRGTGARRPPRSRVPPRDSEQRRVARESPGRAAVIEVRDGTEYPVLCAGQSL